MRPGERVGAFDVLSPLGAGGMGEVYRARDTRLGRDVALKVLPEEFARDAERRARFEREARVLASLNHPSIAALYGLEDGVQPPCLVMELVEGPILSERLARGPFPLREALDLGRQLAEALEAAHVRGVIHRDLKPANIKLTPQGRIKVLDFGLAKALQREVTAADTGDSVTQTRHTEPGMGLGTPGYSSPEQMRGHAHDRRTDIWSFGCVLYEALAGRRAFPGNTSSDLIVSVLAEEPDWNALPAGTPSNVRTLLQRCLHKDPEHRLHDIADARIELEEGAAVLAKDPSPGRTPGTIPRRAFPLATATVLLLLAGLGLLAYRSRTMPTPGASGAKSLAVLPFHVAGEGSPNADLGLGLADDVITHLANFEGLKVRPTRSVVSRTGEGLDLQESGRALGVDHVLSGTVRRSGSGYRVGVQLVRVADGASYWGETFDVAAGELPGLEDRITAEVARALGVRIATTAERTRVYRRYTTNAPAYEAYLQGRAHLVRSTEESMAAAAAAFEEALRLDPDYALAHAGLAITSAEMHLRFAPAAKVAAWGEAARAQARRALALDPNLAEVHQALSAVYGKADFEWDKVIESSRRAIAINPRLELPYSYLARAFYHLGLFELADRNVNQALALDPENRTEPIRTLAVVTLLSGRFTEAVPLFEEVQRMSGRPLSDHYLALAYYYSGAQPRAEALLEELGRSKSASASARARSTLAAVLAARGERSRATALTQEVTAGSYIDHHVANSLGIAFAHLGQKEEAVAWLRKAAETGFPCHPWYARDPLLAPLKGDSGYEGFLAEQERTLRVARERYSKSS